MDKIVIIEGAELERLMDWLEGVVSFRDHTRRIRVTEDGGTFKMKLDEGTWSPPFGELAPESIGYSDYMVDLAGEQRAAAGDPEPF